MDTSCLWHLVVKPFCNDIQTTSWVLSLAPWPCSARCGGQDGHEASSSWNQGMARVCVWPSHKSISVMLSEWLESRSTIHVVLSRIDNIDLLINYEWVLQWLIRLAHAWSVSSSDGKPSCLCRRQTEPRNMRVMTAKLNDGRAVENGRPFALFWKKKSSESFRGTGLFRSDSWNSMPARVLNESQRRPPQIVSPQPVG